MKRNRAAGNTVLAKKGLMEVIDQLCYYQLLCIYSTEGFQIPLLRQYPNRYNQWYDDTQTEILTLTNKFKNENNYGL